MPDLPIDLLKIFYKYNNYLLFTNLRKDIINEGLCSPNFTPIYTNMRGKQFEICKKNYRVEYNYDYCDYILCQD